MKKRNIVRNVSLVALSAVLACGTAAAFAGCGGGKDPYTLEVKIFCDAADAATNKEICEKWAENYTQKLRAEGKIGEDKTIKTTFDNIIDSETYFTELDNDFAQGAKHVADIIYMSPKYTRVWMETGRVMELSQYFTAEDYAETEKVWQNAVSFYGYSKAGYADGSYKLGDALTYNANGEEGPGYYNGNNVKTGLYALPKDYSNFSMGFNNKYFTEDMKKALTTRKADDSRDVYGAADIPRTLHYVGGTSSETSNNGESGLDEVVTYAVSGSYKNPYTLETTTVNKGDSAALINIGVPTTYKPFNFYSFPDYNTAVDKGDPVALAVEEYTGGKGYTVTIPGFPGETFKMPEGTATDPNAYYDASWGHMTLTYAEFSAISWAVSYYCNTFEWTQVNQKGWDNLNDADLWGDPDDNFGIPKGGIDDLKKADPSTLGTKADYENVGRGGIRLKNYKYENVFGGDQYEGPPQPTLYLLPWLAGNDADFIDPTSTKAIQDGVETDTSKMNESTPLGTDEATVKKMRLNGQTADVGVQYGLNSERFAETYAAFLAYGSDWNANSGNARSIADKQKPDNGQALFLAGACIFYGIGTWDGKTNNESPLDLCEFRIMPEPVSEKYSLYSEIKDMKYNLKSYQWNSETHSAVSAPSATQVYDRTAILKNQVDRQDKWGARMDSVGYAVNKYVEKSSGEAEWKKEGAVSLVLALTANEEDQTNLLYGGAQLPNFAHQCVELLQYQNPNYTGNGLLEGASANIRQDGAFKEMLTPEGWATTDYYDLTADGKLQFNEDSTPKTNAEGVEKAQKVWALYCDVATAMSDEAKNGSTQTVAQFIAAYNSSHQSEITAAGETEIKYNTAYANARLIDMAGSNSKIATAMKYLRMVTYTRADRDIDLRMQYGLNSARDSAMYTYESGWIGLISMRTGKIALAYRNQELIPAGTTLKSIVETNPGAAAMLVHTPYVYCLRNAKLVQAKLDESIAQEKNQIW